MIRIVRLRADAENDIYETASWYESQRSRLGHEFLDAVEATLTCVSDNPLQFPVLHRSTRRALLSRFPFGVFFRVEGPVIVVIAVIHAS